MGRISGDLDLDDVLGVEHIEAATRTPVVPPMPPQAAATLATNDVVRKRAVGEQQAAPSEPPVVDAAPEVTEDARQSDAPADTAPAPAKSEPEPANEPSVTLSVRFTRSAYNALREESIKQTLARSQGRVSQSEVVNDLVTLGLAILAASDRNAAGATARQFYDVRFGKPSK